MKGRLLSIGFRYEAGRFLWIFVPVPLQSPFRKKRFAILPDLWYHRLASTPGRERGSAVSGLTKKAIKDSFLKLLNQQPLSKISVRSIVEDCGINRNSFYYHYKDIPALLEEIIKELFHGLIEKYPAVPALDQCLAEAMRFALDNKRAMLHIYNSVSRDVFENYLMQYCDYAVRSYLDTAFGGQQVTPAQQALIVRFLKCELFGAYLEWLSNGMPPQAVEDIQKMLQVCHGLSGEIIRRCREMET